jgi:hypothetical protein
MSAQLREWLGSTSVNEREIVAVSAGTSVAYLYQLAGGHRRASIELASRLNIASAGKLTIDGIRPDLKKLLNNSAA